MARNDNLHGVKGVFVDYGGVIEDLSFDRELFSKGAGIIQGLLDEAGIRTGKEELEDALVSGQDEYNEWGSANDHRELPNEKIWTSFFLAKWCRDDRNRSVVEGRSEDLSSIYEYYLFRRRPARDLVKVVKILFHLGYTLALVSNTMSRILIPERLKKFDIDRFFSAVVLSMNVGLKKPRREIFQEACSQAGLTPEHCIFVGDTLSRDIEGSRKAGFYRSILIPSGLTAHKDRHYGGTATPDYTIKGLSGLIPMLVRA